VSYPVKPTKQTSSGNASTPVQLKPRIRSEALFGDANEVVVVHEGQYYRLRRTRNGKLILNK